MSDAKEPDVKVGDYVAVNAFRSTPAFTGRILHIGEAAPTAEGAPRFFFYVRDDLTGKDWHRNRDEFRLMTMEKVT